MSVPEITNCPGTLAEGFSTYSKTCLNKTFGGRKVSHVLPYDPPNVNDEDDEKYIENRKRISISGEQEKLSVILDKNKLRLTEEGEGGTHILKPIPRDVIKVDQVPANEHLTMQIAQQVYDIPTAENALIFFKNGTPAYITKRFDVKEDGSKWAKEDFASLAGRTSETDGDDFKYNYSYEEIAELLIKYVPAYIIEIEKLYKLIVFNYLFSNGNAHLKNFAVLETASGDFKFSPAYDLLNTSIHVRDSEFALHKGLFKDDFQSKQMKANKHAAKEDFLEFASRLGIKEDRMKKLLQPFLDKQIMVYNLINRSFLDDQVKREYLIWYQMKRNQLNAV